MSTRDALTIVGTAVGAYFGNAQLGYLIGSAVGAAVDPQQIEGPHVGNITAPSTEYGWPLQRFYGRNVHEGQAIWMGPVVEVSTTTDGKGGPEVTEYSARQDALLLFGEASPVAVLRIWVNKKLVYSLVDDAESSAASQETTAFDSVDFLDGNEDQLPWPPHEAAVGVGKCPAYVGRVGLGFKGVALEGGAFPLIEAEFATISARQYDAVPMWQLDSSGDDWLVEPGSIAYADPHIVPLKDGSVYYHNGYAGVDACGTLEQARQLGLFHSFGGVADPGETVLSIIDANIVEALPGYERWMVALSVRMDSLPGTPLETQYYQFTIDWSAPVWLFTSFGSSQPVLQKVGTATAGIANQGRAASGASDVPLVAVVANSTTQQLRVFHGGPIADVGGSSGRGWYARAGGQTYVLQDGGGTLRRFAFGSSGHAAESATTFAAGGHVAATAAAVWVLSGTTVHQLDPTTLATVTTFAAAAGAEHIFANTAGVLHLYGNQRVWERTGATWTQRLDVTGSAFSGSAMLHSPGFEEGVLYATQATAQTPGWPSTWVGYMSAPVEDPSEIEVNDVLLPELLRAGIPPSAIDLSATAGLPLVGYKTAGPARAACKDLADGYLFDWRCNDKLRTFMLATAPVRTLPLDDLGFGVEQAQPDALVIERDGQEEVPRRFSLTVRNADQDHANLTVDYDRRVGSNAEVANVSLPISMHADRAQGLVDSIGRRAGLTSVRTTIAIDDRHAEVEEGDLVVAPDATGIAYTWRLLRSSYTRGVREFEAAMEDVSAFTAVNTATDTAYVPSITVNPAGRAELLLVDAPLLADADDTPGAYAAGALFGARSAGLYRSIDDAVYDPVGAIARTAISGRLETALPAASPDVWDRQHVIRVRVTGGTLASATADALQADPRLNVMAVGGHERWQYLRWQTATLVEPGVYDLSTLLQGWRGTEHQVGRQRAGDLVVVMQASALTTAPITNAEIGVTRYWKAAPAGRRLSSVTAQALAFAGERQRPLSPTMPRFERDATGGTTTASWTRRTRLGIRLSGIRSVPLGEQAEVYDVDFFDDPSYTLPTRTVTVTSPRLVVTDAERASFGDYLRIHQVSATVGRGRPLSTVLPTV